MIEIIAQIGNPIYLPAYKDFLPGQIIKLTRTPTQVYCSLSDSINPFGIVINNPNEFGLIPILYTSASLIKTDNFEINLKYKMGNLIYCNEYGVLTLKKYKENAVPIAYVENDLKPNKLLEIRWI